MKLTKSIFILAVSIILLSACSKKKPIDDSVTPAQVLYNKGSQLLQNQKFEKAADEFEKIFFQHPGKKITPKAELMQAYSLYLAGDYDVAYDVLDVFVKLHPRHPEITYAYYMKALCNYAQISSVELDQSRTERAKYGFVEVINRFPGSKYALDATLKMDLIDNHLAGKEMLVGRYYLKKNNPIAAITRFQAVIKKFENTTHVEEALFRMVESNVMLGLRNEAQKYAAVLGHNYAGGKWYKRAYDLLN